MARQHLKGGALTAPFPPALVSVGDGEEANLITIGWTGILATIPPTTYISVRPERYSYRLLKKNGEFVIHLAGEALAPAVDYCGIYTGEKVDKFKNCGLTPIPSKHVKCPTVAECPVAIECRVKQIIPMGSHDVFVADIVGVSVDDALFDETGKIHLEWAHLLAYMHGEYFTVGRRVGKFGYSATKSEKGGVKGAVKARSSENKPKRHTGEKEKAPTKKRSLPKKKKSSKKGKEKNS